jgi:hypothetical protein
MNARVPQANPFREIEVSFPRIAERPRPPPPMAQPNLIVPVMPSAMPALPGLSVPKPAPALPPGSIGGIGRALFGCDALNLDRLSPEDRARCLRLGQGAPHERSVRLGPAPDPDSPFTREIEERFREARPINRPCASGSYEDLHGLPCFGFDEKAPLLGR